MKVSDWVRTQISLTTGLLGLGFLFPFLSPALLSYSRMFLPRAGLRTFLFYAGVFSLALAMLNAGKLVEADEENYFFFFQEILDGGVNGLTGNILDITGRSEVVFYWISYFIFGVLGASFKAVTVFWTFFTYLVSSLAFAKIFREKVSYSHTLPIFIFCVILLINFTLTAQVMRQYAAGALVIAAFSYFDKRKLSFISLVMAGGIHNSAFLFLIPWGLSIYLQSRTNKVPSLLILLPILAISFLIGKILYSLGGEGAEEIQGWVLSGMKEDGDIGAFKLISIIASAAILFYEMKTQFDRNLLPLFTGFFFLIGLLLMAREFPLMLLRFSFYVEFFAFIAVAMLFFRVAKYVSGATLLILPIVANTLLLVRVFASPWTYSWFGGSLSENFIIVLLLRMVNAS